MYPGVAALRQALRTIQYPKHSGGFVNWPSGDHLAEGDPATIEVEHLGHTHKCEALMSLGRPRLTGDPTFRGTVTYLDYTKDEVVGFKTLHDATTDDAGDMVRDTYAALERCMQSLGPVENLDTWEGR